MKFFLVGYYGFDNTGDDICLIKTKEIIKSTIPNASFAILGSSKQYINRNNLVKVIYTLATSDRVVFGGGGLCQNVTSSLSLYYYLFLIALACLFKKPLYALAQGIGPIQGKFNNWITMYMLKRFKSISIRDSSYESFIKEKKAIVSSDLAFYKESLHRSQGCLQKVGINICKLNYMPQIQQIVLKLKSEQLESVYLSFSKSQDLNLIETLNTHSDSILNIGDHNFYTKTNSELKFIVAMRYHCCIWAAIQGIPFIALAYDEKVMLLAKQLQQPYIEIFKNEFSMQLFCAKYNDLNKNYNTFKSYLETQRDELSNLATLNEMVLIS